VKDRAVEEFEVTLNLPDWMTEPDEEALYGDPDEYYYIDENGNLVEPGRREAQPDPFGPDAEPERSPPPAASEDFLQQATGSPRPRPSPAPP
jgi:penicillin-binding protein 1A